MNTPAMQELSANYQAAQAAKSPQQLQIDAQNDAMRQQMLQQQATMSQVQAGNGGLGNMPGGAFNSGSYVPTQLPAMASAPAAAAGADAADAARHASGLSRRAGEPRGRRRRSGPRCRRATRSARRSVLNAFMAAHPSGGAKGAGNYDNSGFFSTLNNLKSA